TRSRVAPRGELGQTAAADRPDPRAEEALTLLVHPPERPVLPAHPLAQLAQEADDHLLFRRDLGQNPRHRSLSVDVHRAATAIADVVQKGVEQLDIARPPGAAR